jgi:hypothetical protein
MVGEVALGVIWGGVEGTGWKGDVAMLGDIWASFLSSSSGGGDAVKGFLSRVFRASRRGEPGGEGVTVASSGLFEVLTAFSLSFCARSTA